MNTSKGAAMKSMRLLRVGIAVALFLTPTPPLWAEIENPVIPAAPAERNQPLGARDRVEAGRPGAELPRGRAAGQDRVANAAIARVENQLGHQLSPEARQDIRNVLAQAPTALARPNGRPVPLTAARADMIAKYVLSARESLPEGQANLTDRQVGQVTNAACWATIFVNPARGAGPNQLGARLTLNPEGDHGQGNVLISLNTGASVTRMRTYVSNGDRTQVSAQMVFNAKNNNQISYEMNRADVGSGTGRFVQATLLHGEGGGLDGDTRRTMQGAGGRSHLLGGDHALAGRHVAAADVRVAGRAVALPNIPPGESVRITGFALTGQQGVHFNYERIPTPNVISPGESQMRAAMNNPGGNGGNVGGANNNAAPQPNAGGTPPASPPSGSNSASNEPVPSSPGASPANHQTAVALVSLTPSFDHSQVTATPGAPAGNFTLTLPNAGAVSSVPGAGPLMTEVHALVQGSMPQGTASVAAALEHSPDATVKVLFNPSNPPGSQVTGIQVGNTMFARPPSPAAGQPAPGLQMGTPVEAPAAAPAMAALPAAAASFAAGVPPGSVVPAPDHATTGNFVFRGTAGQIPGAGLSGGASPLGAMLTAMSGLSGPAGTAGAAPAWRANLALVNAGVANGTTQIQVTFNPATQTIAKVEVRQNGGWALYHPNAEENATLKAAAPAPGASPSSTLSSFAAGIAPAGIVPAPDHATTGNFVFRGTASQIPGTGGREGASPLGAMLTAMSTMSGGGPAGTAIPSAWRANLVRINTAVANGNTQLEVKFNPTTQTIVSVGVRTNAGTSYYHPTVEENDALRRMMR